MDRRSFMTFAGSAGLIGFVPLWMMHIGYAEERFAVHMTEDEWRKKLTPDQYLVLRQEGTERAFTSPLNDEHRRGVFKCAGCGWDLFSSDAKFDSGTGWPSFFQPLNDKAVGISTDHKLIYPRTEVHCAHCGGHLGHVFDDGPQPTGKRYCMNGIAMNFIPGESE